MSSLTLAELRFGAERRRSRELHGMIEVFTRSIQVMPFDEPCAASYGRIQTALEAKGTPLVLLVLWTRSLRRMRLRST